MKNEKKEEMNRLNEIVKKSACKRETRSGEITNMNKYTDNKKRTSI